MRYPLTAYQDPPLNEGRYHRNGGTPAWYASNQEQASWAEMMRHLNEKVSPFEIRRRMGAVLVVDLRVLDLCNWRTRRQLEVVSDDLLDDDTTVCQDIAEYAGDLFEGILAPSAALADRRTLAVFPKGMGKLQVVTERVRQPPPRMADLLTDIRLHHEMPAAVRGLLRGLAAEGADAIRRKRRGDDVVLGLADKSYTG